MPELQGDSNMTRTGLCVNKPQSVPVIFEPPCILRHSFIGKSSIASKGINTLVKNVEINGRRWTEPT
jgi:hypothetical protein